MPAIATRKPTKLHELIAALPERLNAAKANIAETIGVFEKKAADLFLGFVKVTTSVDDARKAEFDSKEEKVLTSTVRKRLDYTFGLIITAIDVQLQVDETNQLAVADIVIGDNTLATGVPAVTLLNLEKQIKIWQDMVLRAPTLETGKEWEKDASIGDNVWKTKNSINRNRTEKQPYFITTAPATDKHQALVVEKVRDVIVANIVEDHWSGAIPSIEKAEILSRLQELGIAVQTARQRANEVEAKQRKIGASLRDYVLTGAFQATA